MRILLFTGKGGVGKSTVSAGTAAMSAARGLRTLVLSTDAAHSLGDAFGVDGALGSEPVQVTEHLYVQHVDAQRRFEESWAEVQGYLLSVLDTIGVDRIAAEELTIIPGAEEVFALLELRRMAVSGSGTRSWSTAPRPPRRCGCSPFPRPWAGISSASSRCSARW